MRLLFTWAGIVCFAAAGLAGTQERTPWQVTVSLLMLAVVNALLLTGKGTA